MSLQNGASTSLRSNHPFAVELGIITALLIGVYLWRELVREALTAVFGTQPVVGGLLFSALVSGGVLLLGLVVLTGAYATFRDINTGLRLPSRNDATLAGIAVLVPVVCVAATKLVGSVTGVPYNSLTKTSVAADASVLPVLLIAGLGLIVGVPVLVVICQVLIQGSFEQVVSADVAVVLTTVMAGFVMVSNTGGLATVPELGKLLGAVVFTLALSVAVYATERVAHSWLRYLGVAPVLLVTAIILLSGIAEIETIAGGLYAATQLIVLGVAAYTYSETESLFVPALAYASLLLANRTVVFVFEAGMQSW
jgi:hypothetical protein